MHLVDKDPITGRRTGKQAWDAYTLSGSRWSNPAKGSRLDSVVIGTRERMVAIEAAEKGTARHDVRDSRRGPGLRAVLESIPGPDTGPRMVEIAERYRQAIRPVRQRASSTNSIRRCARALIPTRNDGGGRSV